MKEMLTGWNRWYRDVRCRILRGAGLRGLMLCMLAAAVVFTLSGCVDQSQGKSGTGQSSSTEKQSTGAESDRDSGNKENSGQGDQPVIIATSMATVDICDKLDLDLAGVPDSSLYEDRKSVV